MDVLSRIRGSRANAAGNWSIKTLGYAGRFVKVLGDAHVSLPADLLAASVLGLPCGTVPGRGGLTSALPAYRHASATIRALLPARAAMR